MSYGADKLVIDARTDTYTDRQMQATTIPKGQNWPRVKMRNINYDSRVNKLWLQSHLSNPEEFGLTNHINPLRPGSPFAARV